MTTETEQQAVPPAAAAGAERIIKLRPTLYIGMGGTGLEVMLRIRRRILNATWGSRSAPVRLDSVADFPIAQFMHFDLDQNALGDSGRNQLDDPLTPLVKLPEEDRLVEDFTVEKYCRGDDELARYPHIEEWSPLTPRRIRELNIDPSKGAGQIRAFSRLYFFDKYSKVKDRIRTKLIWLKSGLTKDARLKSLGLELDQAKFRIVVIASVAGGTGGGSFLDMGYLASWVAHETVNYADVELMLLLPTGYHAANKERTEANGYASLMELEMCERGGPSFVTKWDAYDRPVLPDKPYTEVYLIDSGNLAQLHTSDQNDVYDMLADALFEDFGSVDFANKKRSVAVNQAQHKLTPFSPPVPANRFGDMKLSYYCGYSALGQAVLDTQRSLQRDISTYRWAAAMLRAFFGVGARDVQANRATDRQRDDFLAAQMALRPQVFSDLPDLSSRDVDLRLATGEFTDYQLTDDLLTDRQGSIPAGIQQKVDAALERIITSFERKEWGAQVRIRLKELEADVVKDEHAKSEVSEDRVVHRADELYDDITARLRVRLYELLDNKEFGGLEFVLSLVELLKDRLENNNTGIIAALTLNSKRYAELHNAVRTSECERLLKNLGQTGGFSLFSNSEKQAVEIMGQLKTEIGNSLKLYVRAKSAATAAQLLGRLSVGLGVRTGVDHAGNAVWNGLVGELNEGRAAVLGMLTEIDAKLGQLQEDTRKDHATYLRVTAPETGDLAVPDDASLRGWADEAFRDFGGSAKIFPMLTEPAQRAQLLSRLINKAIAQISVAGARSGDEVDPLVAALDAMTPTVRQRKFSELLSRAMPWIDAGWGKDFSPNPDRFKCYVGVGRARDFKKFEQELASQVPVQAGITSNQVSFVDSGVPGRAVCYCELSGIPITVLRGLEGWRTSYRRESEKIPLHTHRDSSRFTHPIAPSTGELNQLAEDYQQFLTAVLIGVLVRDGSTKVVPPGQYQFQVGRGDSRRVGNERAFRLNGLPTTYRKQIMDAVAERLDTLSGWQLAALAALADFHAREVYTPRLIQDELGVDLPRRGFASAIAGALARELAAKATRKGLAQSEVVKIEHLAYENVERWTEVVENSDSDPYSWEVSPPVDAPRLKRVARKEFFAAPNFDALVVDPQRAPLAPAAPAGVGAGFAAPPPPPPSVSFMVAVDGQTYGPYAQAQLRQMAASGQFTRQSMVWREGMTQWQAAALIPELNSLFTAAPAGMPPPPPPQQSPGS